MGEDADQLCDEAYLDRPLMDHTLCICPKESSWSGAHEDDGVTIGSKTFPFHVDSTFHPLFMSLLFVLICKCIL